MEPPKTLLAAVEHLLANTPADQQQIASGLDWDTFLGLHHHGLGMAIRNEFKLWHDNTALLADALGSRYTQKQEGEGYPYADDASSIILVVFWQRCWLNHPEAPKLRVCDTCFAIVKRDDKQHVCFEERNAGNGEV